MTERLAVVLACDDGYVRQTAVAARSTLQHLDRPAQVFVIGVDLSDASARVLEELVGESTEVVDAPLDLLRQFPVGRLPQAMWSRFFIGSLVPAEFHRAIYLDSDVLVRGPIDELVSVPLHGLTLGACTDYWVPTHSDSTQDLWRSAQIPPSVSYFNSGVLVVDLDRWRSIGAAERLLAFATSSAAVFENPDQDVLNCVLWDQWLPLLQQWNYPAQVVGRDSYSARIVHFFGERKPWVTSCENAHFQREYRIAAREIGWKVSGPSWKPRRIGRLVSPQIVKDLRFRAIARRSAAAPTGSDEADAEAVDR